MLPAAIAQSERWIRQRNSIWFRVQRRLLKTRLYSFNVYAPPERGS